MQSGVPPMHESLLSDSLAVIWRSVLRGGGKTFRAGLLVLGLLSTLLFASSALGATATVGLGTAASFSVLGGSTVTNTGPTTMFGDLGLSPGSSVTGAPHVLGQTHVDDAVAIGAKNALTTGLQRRRFPPEQRLGRDRPRRSDLLARRSQRQQLVAAVIGERHARRPGRPQRGVHLPDRLHADHRLEHQRLSWSTARRRATSSGRSAPQRRWVRARASSARSWPRRASPRIRPPRSMAGCWREPAR